jgi:uncharacterized phage protein (TIGR01671 family)
MNNRFKFRAWDKENKIMHYNAECAYDSMNGTPPLMHDSFGSLLDDDNFIIEQCTGQTDMEDRLIYENDIVNVYRPMLDAYEKAVVIWADAESCWVCKWLKPAEVKRDCWHSADSGTYFQGSHCRVVGHIHEMEVCQ